MVYVSSYLLLDLGGRVACAKMVCLSEPIASNCFSYNGICDGSDAVDLQFDHIPYTQLESCVYYCMIVSDFTYVFPIMAKTTPGRTGVKI
jgi:hypothetical protein